MLLLDLSSFCWDSALLANLFLARRQAGCLRDGGTTYANVSPCSAPSSHSHAGNLGEAPVSLEREEPRVSPSMWGSLCRGSRPQCQSPCVGRRRPCLGSTLELSMERFPSSR